MSKASVIVTLHNYAHFLTACIDSVARQNFKDKELIIVDDSSTDQPFKVVETFRKCGLSIKYIQLYEKQNYAVAKNIGIKESSGEFIIMLDADDCLTKDSIATRVKPFFSLPNIDIVHGPCFVYWGMKNPLLDKHAQKTIDPMWDKFLQTNDFKWIHAQGFAVRRSTHEKFGYYAPDMWAQADREFLLRLQKNKAEYFTTHYPVAIYRRHEDQMHKSKKKQQDRSNLDSMMMNKIDNYTDIDYTKPIYVAGKDYDIEVL